MMITTLTTWWMMIYWLELYYQGAHGGNVNSVAFHPSVGTVEHCINQIPAPFKSTLGFQRLKLTYRLKAPLVTPLDTTM